MSKFETARAISATEAQIVHNETSTSQCLSEQDFGVAPKKRVVDAKLPPTPPHEARGSAYRWARLLNNRGHWPSERKLQ